MFNGIIFNQGKIVKISKTANGINLFLKSKINLSKKNLGISVSCDGVCLTLISVKKDIIEFYLSNETISRSKFSKSKIGDKINLELPLQYKQRISGHICQGHVDTVSKLSSIKKYGKSQVLEFEIKTTLKKYLIAKASILINGVSLTISKVLKNSFQIWVIPHTYKETNLSSLKKKSLVNIEIDILSKYVRNYFNDKK